MEWILGDLIIGKHRILKPCETTGVGDSVSLSKCKKKRLEPANEFFFGGGGGGPSAQPTENRGTGNREMIVLLFQWIDETQQGLRN